MEVFTHLSFWVALFASLSGLPWESPRQSLERPQAFSFGGTSSAWAWACVESSTTTVADSWDGQRKCDTGPQKVSGTSMCSFGQFSHAFKNIQIKLSIYIYTYTHFYTLIFFSIANMKSCYSCYLPTCSSHRHISNLELIDAPQSFKPLQSSPLYGGALLFKPTAVVLLHSSITKWLLPRSLITFISLNPMSPFLVLLLCGPPLLSSSLLCFSLMFVLWRVYSLLQVTPISDMILKELANVMIHSKSNCDIR